MSEGINDIYVKAFNQAYLLAKFNVSLLDKILSSHQEGEYFDGLRDGKKTFEQEQAHQRQNELKNLHARKSQDKNRER